MTKMAAALCAAVLTLSACGGGSEEPSQEGAQEEASSDSPEEAEAKSNIKTAILEEEGTELTGGAKPSEEQADCISGGMVDEVGIDKLQEYELLTDKLKINEEANPTDMESGDADALAGVFVDCIDVEEMLTSQFSSSEQEIPAEAQECIREAVDEDAMKDGLSASFQGKEDEGFTAMQQEMTACVMGDMGDMGGGAE